METPTWNLDRKSIKHIETGDEGPHQLRFFNAKIAGVDAGPNKGTSQFGAFFEAMRMVILWMVFSCRVVPWFTCLRHCSSEKNMA